MDVGSRKNGNAGFSKRKPAKSPGVWGQSPRRLFASFLHAEKGCGRAFDSLFSKIAFFLRGRPAIPVFSGLACGPPPFLATRKGEKNRQGALPPEPPGGFVDFLSMKIDSDAGPSSRPYKKGCGPGDGLPHFFSPAPNRSPGASGPLVVWTSVQEISYPPIFWGSGGNPRWRFCFLFPPWKKGSGPQAKPIQ